MGQIEFGNLNLGPTVESDSESIRGALRIKADPDVCRGNAPRPSRP